MCIRDRLHTNIHRRHNSTGVRTNFKRSTKLFTFTIYGDYNQIIDVYKRQQLSTIQNGFYAAGVEVQTLSAIICGLPVGYS